jgi:hypothetical protein
MVIKESTHEENLPRNTRVAELIESGADDFGIRERPGTDSEIMQAATGPMSGFEKRSFINELQQRKM